MQSIARQSGSYVRVKEPCPKCGGRSWYEWEGNDMIQRCLCGLCRFVLMARGDFTIMHSQPVAEVVLPRPKTKLSRCLGALASCHPAPTSTSDIALLVKCTSSDTASQLMVLMNKGLVERVTLGRGKAGGSTWILTLRARKHLPVG